MGLGKIRISWWSKAQTAVGALLELVGVIPRERCWSCGERRHSDDLRCRACGAWRNSGDAPLSEREKEGGGER